MDDNHHAICGVVSVQVKRGGLRHKPLKLLVSLTLLRDAKSPCAPEKKCDIILF